MEIYPAALSGLVGKRDPVLVAERVRDDDRIPVEWKAHAACSEDAFDATASALRMAEHVEQLTALEAADAERPYSREGRIWLPAEQ